MTRVRIIVAHILALVGVPFVVVGSVVWGLADRLRLRDGEW